LIYLHVKHCIVFSTFLEPFLGVNQNIDSKEGVEIVPNNQVGLSTVVQFICKLRLPLIDLTRRKRGWTRLISIRGGSNKQQPRRAAADSII
jgi:hypothetical protein